LNTTFTNARLLAAVVVMSSAVIPAPVLLADGPDFNGDGFDDLAVGIPNETIDDQTDCGAVQVFYGSSVGLNLADDQIWHQNQDDIEGECEFSESFGEALAWGDFDGDGFDDLAIGIPGQDVDGQSAAGAVAVLYGSRIGLRARRNEVWTQASPDIADDPEPVDLFGNALASGDFNRDGFDDLAVGAEFEEINGMEAAGAVNIIYGSPDGLNAAGNQFLHQDVSGVEDSAEQGDRFGNALVAGDFNGDGRDDLAVGVWLEAFGDLGDPGAVHVFHGSHNGLRTANSQFWHQDVPGIPDRAEDSNYFGSDLASGDFNRDGFDDLAIGIEEEDFGPLCCGGAVQVLYGSGGGLSAAGDQFLHQDRPGVEDRVEDGDRFGSDVVAGDFNGDGFDDLAVGIPDESVGAAGSTGAVAIFRGSAAGLRTDNDVLLHQNSPGIPDVNEDGDSWGAALAAGDYNGDGRDDLAVGAPGQGIPFANGQTITDVTVRIFGFTHTFPDDVDILLVGPGGENVILMSDAGGSTDVANLSPAFTDSGSGIPVPDNGPLETRTYNPSNSDGGDGDVFPEPAPAPSGNTLLSVFDGTDPEGVWKLFIIDDAETEIGALAQGWTLSLQGFGDYRSFDNIAIPGAGDDAGPASPYPSRIRVDGIIGGGAVTILFGSPQGITGAGSQFIHQNTPQVENKGEYVDRFGEVM